MELEGTINSQTCSIISVPAAHHYFLSKSMFMLHKNVYVVISNYVLVIFPRAPCAGV